jgi:UDP-glucose 4-epimerase
VTGSSGTIGSRLCEHLEQQSIDYMGIDVKENSWNKKVNLNTIKLDLRKSINSDQLPGNIDIIVHLAANARVFKLVQDPDLARDNFLTAYNVFEFARKQKIPKVIFSSSREAYGNSGEMTYSENEAYIRNCESNYTASKIGGEALLHAYNQCYDMDMIILRFSNVYGRYDFSDRVIPLFISKAFINEDIIIYGKDKVIDFTHIDDTVAGIMGAIQYFDKAKNNTYNIATGKGFPLEKVAQIITKHIGAKSKLIIKDNRRGEITHFIADISKAHSTLSYVPKFDLVTGLAETIKWYSSRLNAYSKQLLDY